MKKLSTKEYLAAALEELLKENSFSSISVQDIVSACGVSRTTFYRHFEDKYSLMNWIYRQQIEKILLNNAHITDWKSFVFEVYSYVYSKISFFKKTFSYQGQNSLLDYIYSLSYDYCSSLLKKALKTEILSEDIVFSIRMYCYGTIHILKDWILSDAKEPPELMAQYTCDNIPFHIQQYFR